MSVCTLQRCRYMPCHSAKFWLSCLQHQHGQQHARQLMAMMNCCSSDAILCRMARSALQVHVPIPW